MQRFSSNLGSLYANLVDLLLIYIYISRAFFASDAPDADDGLIHGNG